MDVRAVPLRPPAAAAGTEARIRDAAVEFEAVFLSEMLRGMSSGLGPDGLFGREPFGSLLGDEYARVIARAGGIGIAAATRRELLRLQEAAP
jgi:Rod binding domain-containing protein